MAEQERPRYREARAAERGKHRKFALDCVRPAEDLAGRLLAHHHLAPARATRRAAEGHVVGWVRLSVPCAACPISTG